MEQEVDETSFARCTRRCQIGTDQPCLAISRVRYERLPIMHSIPDGGKIGVYHTSDESLLRCQPS